MPGKDGGAIDAQTVARAAEEVGDRAVSKTADGVPHGVFDAGPALGARFAALHLQALHVAVDGEEILADERGFYPAFKEVALDGNEGCSGDAGVCRDAGDGVAIGTRAGRAHRHREPEPRRTQLR